ncbi:aminoglycoside phosphotransferase family protein [Paenibacillus mesophilus]|uniref:aminoglycoside phosphotransferase family protein n=1 Tax=Paenibacillus mesophilus TaxID=2582849 RepID=UPI00110EE2A7|nr:aminoglycoside phosphotransferase family protein [Paenibacillus mesophilus]TMV43760.1 aminoglycoside phosphotransferase family protein [Paenibacillus mesophilus]
MEELIIHIRKKVEELLHTKVDDIEKLENVPNNSVYKILVKNRPYIFKIYKQRNWPEDGKLIFINRKLIENHIGCAKMIAFDRNDSFFQTGFLLEECLPGLTADQIVFDSESGKEFYKKLALLVSKIHRIHIENYGYIGSGNASYNSFIESMSDKYDEIAKALINKKLFDKNSLLEIKKPVIDKLRLSDNLPSVLNHGDLSTKNVIVDNHGELTLIDWDDAMSYNWIADISRMTYWMKFQYNDYEYAMYRNTFMEHYSTDSSNFDFNVFENTLHVWIGLDYLNYLSNKPQYEETLAYFKETVDKLNL